jgi:hypothetical protein
VALRTQAINGTDMSKVDVNEQGKARLSNGINTLSGIALGSAGVLATSIDGGALIGLIGGLSPIAGDYIARSLSLKEHERVGTVATTAVREIGINIAAGKRLRTDDFFKAVINQLCRSLDGQST